MTTATAATETAELIERTRAHLSVAVNDAHETWSRLSDALAPAAERDHARLVFLAALAATAAFLDAMGMDS